jgi:UDP-glucose 4-epimerase
VEALIRLMDTDRSVGEVTNVGNTEEITIENLADMVKERIKSTSAIEYVPYDKAYEPGFEDMMRRVPSVEKLYALTGFRPQTPLTEIIDRVTQSIQAKHQGVADFQPTIKTMSARQGSELMS